MHSPRYHPALRSNWSIPTSCVQACNSRYAAPANGGETGAAYLAGLTAVWSTTPGSIPLPHGTGLTPNPGSLNHNPGRVLVPIVAVPTLSLSGTLSACPAYVNHGGT